MSDLDAKACDILAYNPFDGDRDSQVRVMSDKLLTTRKPHRCTVCWDDIPPGARVRARSEVDQQDRRAMTFYFCPPCCEAMALSWTDEDAGKAIEARTAIGMRKAGALPDDDEGAA